MDLTEANRVTDWSSRWWGSHPLTTIRLWPGKVRCVCQLCQHNCVHLIVCHYTHICKQTKMRGLLQIRFGSGWSEILTEGGDEQEQGVSQLHSRHILLTRNMDVACLYLGVHRSCRKYPSNVTHLTSTLRVQRTGSSITLCAFEEGRIRKDHSRCRRPECQC